MKILFYNIHLLFVVIILKKIKILQNHKSKNKNSRKIKLMHYTKLKNICKNSVIPYIYIRDGYKINRYHNSRNRKIMSIGNYNILVNGMISGLHFTYLLLIPIFFIFLSPGFLYLLHIKCKRSVYR